MKPTIALFAVLLAPAASSQLLTDTMIADINADPAVIGSYSGAFAWDGVHAWFRGIDEDTGEGYRAWATDGTTGGTVQLSEESLNVGEAMVASNGVCYFIADELGGDGVAVWKSDGTAAGTSRLLPAGTWSAQPRDLVEFGGDIWFLAGQPATGIELWKHDPVAGTTALGLEIIPGVLSGAAELLAATNKLIVVGPGLSQIKSTDGTAGSITTIATISGASTGSFNQTARVGDKVVFDVAGFGAGADAGWWATDGTAAGTALVLPTFNNDWIVEADTKVYLTGGTQASTPRLFETDGTVAGTQHINFPGIPDGQRVDYKIFGMPAMAVGDELFYSGLAFSAGFELCRTTGAAGGAVLATDINPLTDSDPLDFVEFGGDVYFRAEDGVHGREIWRYDPSTPGTPAHLVEDLWPGPGSTIVGQTPTLASAAGGVVFGQGFAAFGMEPAVTDGVTTGLLLNIAEDPLSDGSDPREFARLGSTVLFQAIDEVVGGELFLTDGTQAGTQLVLDIDPTVSPFPGSFGSFPHHLVTWGDRVYFFAFHPSFGNELWSTDGTAAGTALVADVIPGPQGVESQFSKPPVVLGDHMYFIGLDAAGGLALYRTDGTAAGTTHVINTDPGGILTEFVQLEVFDGKLLFAGRDIDGVEVWVSDGTAEGTSVLVDASPGLDHSFVRRILAGDAWAYLSITLSTGANTMWRTDGTTAGTTQFFSGHFGPTAETFAGETLVFSMTDGATGREPWISDGTELGTTLLKDVAPGTLSSDVFEFTPAGDLVYFAVESPPDSLHYGQVWVSDLTEAGTVLVADLPSPLAGAGVGDFWAVGTDSRLLFSNVDPNGEEWWLTDGTLAGTQALADIAPGPAHAKPTVGMLVGDTLIFVADDGVNGRELHAIPFLVTGSSSAVAIGSGCAGSNGVPSMRLAAGAPTVGGNMTLAVDHAVSAGLVAWAYDDAFSGPVAAGTCGIQLVAPLSLGASATDAAGTAHLAATLPSTPTLAGLVLDVQAFSIEVGGPFLGLGSTSDVLELVVGP